MIRQRVLGLFFLFLATTSLQAQQPFRAAVSGQGLYGCLILPLISYHLQWITPNRVEDGTNVRMIASGDGLNVFGLLFGSTTRIVRVEPDGTQTPFYEDLTSSAGALAVGADGRVFAAIFAGGEYRLAVISSAGTLEATYPLPVTTFPETMAVAADGCTIFYVAFDATVRRINGCTGAVLPDFVTTTATWLLPDVDPLPNGEVLVTNNRTVVLYDAAGTPIRTVVNLSSYGFPEHEFVGQIAATDDLSELWLTASGCEVQGYLLRVAFDDGRELERRATVVNFPSALVIGSNDATVGIPTAGTTALLLLAVGIAIAAMVRL